MALISQRFKAVGELTVKSRGWQGLPLVFLPHADPERASRQELTHLADQALDEAVAHLTRTQNTRP